MRRSLTFVWALGLVFLISANCFGALNTRRGNVSVEDSGLLTVHGSRIPIQDLLREISQKTGIAVFVIDPIRPDSLELDLANRPIEDVLRLVLKGYNYAVVYDHDTARRRSSNSPAVVSQYEAFFEAGSLEERGGSPAATNGPVRGIASETAHGVGEGLSGRASIGNEQKREMPGASLRQPGGDRARTGKPVRPELQVSQQEKTGEEEPRHAGGGSVLITNQMISEDPEPSGTLESYMGQAVFSGGIATSGGSGSGSSGSGAAGYESSGEEAVAPPGSGQLQAQQTEADPQKSKIEFLEGQIAQIQERIISGESDMQYEKWTKVKQSKYVMHDRDLLEHYQKQLDGLL